MNTSTPGGSPGGLTVLLTTPATAASAALFARPSAVMTLWLGNSGSPAPDRH
jgi:hypothetical protein